MFERTRPEGDWLDLTAVSGSEFEDIDAKLAKAIDGTGGGAYEPVDRITVGGAGLEVAGDGDGTGLLVSGGEFIVGTGVTSIFNGNAVVDAGFQVTHEADLVGDVTMHANASVGGVLAVTGDTQLGAGLSVTGLAAFQGIAGFDSVVQMNAQVNCAAELNVGTTLGVSGAANLNDALTVAGETTLNGLTLLNNELVLGNSGAGGSIRHGLTFSTISNDGDAITIDTRFTDIVMVGGGGVLAGHIKWNIKNAGVDGRILHVSRVLDTTSNFVYVINDVDKSMIINLDGLNYASAVLVSFAGGWRVLHYGIKSAFG